MQNMSNKDRLCGIMGNNKSGSPRHRQDGVDCYKNIYSSVFSCDSLLGFFTGGIDLPQIDHFHYLFYQLISRQKNGDCEFGLKQKL
jgi:hypothetical protein